MGQSSKPKGRPRTTGSRATKPVSFRLSAEERERLDRRAKAMGWRPNYLAEYALMVFLADQVDPGPNPG